MAYRFIPRSRAIGTSTRGRITPRSFAQRMDVILSGSKHSIGLIRHASAQIGDTRQEAGYRLQPRRYRNNLHRHITKSSFGEILWYLPWGMLLAGMWVVYSQCRRVGNYIRSIKSGVRSRYHRLVNLVQSGMSSVYSQYSRSVDFIQSMTRGVTTRWYDLRTSIGKWKKNALDRNIPDEIAGRASQFWQGVISRLDAVRGSKSPVHRVRDYLRPRQPDDKIAGERSSFRRGLENTRDKIVEGVSQFQQGITREAAKQASSKCPAHIFRDWLRSKQSSTLR